jgi:tetratricopeptide (TPR) repeat protein
VQVGNKLWFNVAGEARLAKSEPAKNPHEPRVGSVEELARVMLRHRSDDEKTFSPTVFFVGAGCSVSAGVPTGAMIAQERTCYLARKYRCIEGTDPVKAYNAMVRQGHFHVPPAATPATPAADLADAEIDWGHAYDQIFDDHIRDAPAIRDYFGTICAEQKVKVNWSHLCLGELVRRKDVSTIITTNFDQLVLRGLVYAGIVPPVSDGIEALNRVDPTLRFAQLIELHGSRHNYTLRNSKKAVEAVKKDPGAPSTLNALFGNSRLFVVVGYAGREAGVMDLLIEAGKLYPDHEIVWVMHEASPAKLGDQARDFLATSQHGRLIVGQDSDEFFLQLCQSLNVGAPRALSDPVAGFDGLMANLAIHANPKLAQEVERARKGLNFLKGAYGRFLSEQSELEKALRQAQELFLAGNDQRALEILLKLPENQRDTEVWRAIGEVALQHDHRANPKSLDLAVAAWRHLLETGSRADQKDAANLKSKLAHSLQRLGENTSGNAALSEAIGIYSALLASDHTRQLDPQSWASTQNDLGTALLSLGELESGTARLEEAVVAYRAALEERTRERAPLEWALTQNNLGTALWRLGERESGTARLEEAVVAYRAALEERTRERVPLEWALTQNNLGTALWRLGERENDTARVEEAVVAYRAALEERTRERVPLEWALTQNNLATALWRLGERESGTARLEEAVTAYRAALEERTGKRERLNWAKTQINLGAALRTLGERQSGTARLQEAVIAYRAGLEEYTRDQGRLYWAMTQTNLGAALRTLGERESGTARLEEAVTAYRLALEEYTRERVPLQWEQTTRNLEMALQILDERQGGREKDQPSPERI